MNLSEFQKYRENCTSCGYPMVTRLGLRQQSSRLEDGRLIILFTLDKLDRKCGRSREKEKYKVGYSFGLEDNSWHVEFYSKDGLKFVNEAPTFLMERFKELDKNLPDHTFFRICQNCHSHFYQSNTFVLDRHNARILCPEDSIVVKKEYLGIATPIEDQWFKILKIRNDYDGGTCHLSYGRTEHHYTAHARVEHSALHRVDLPLLDLSNKQKVEERLHKLLVFS